MRLLVICVNFLSCRAKDGSPETTKGERFFPLQNGALQIIRAEKDDSGEYVCAAFNMMGDSAVTAVLDVKGNASHCTRSFTERIFQI